MNWKQIFDFRSRWAKLGRALGVLALAGVALLGWGDWALIARGGAVALAFAAAGALRAPGEGSIPRSAEAAWCAAALLAMFLGAQLSVGRAPQGMGLPAALLNVACAALPFFLLLALTARPKLALALTWAALLLLAVGNYCVFLFRGTELTPADLRTIGTGLSVAGNYKFQLSGRFFVSLCVWALVPFSCLRLPRRPARPLRARALGLAAAAALACVCVPACRGMELQSYGDADTAQRGLLASFGARLADSLRDPRPEGYSPERVAELEARYDGGEAASAPEGAPDVIVIMDESFADPDVLGPGLGEQVIPFFRSLKENCVRGRALASVYGGGTAHSEYAFLTGNALERLPQRTSVYSLYIDEPVHSLVSEFARLGYATAAAHPYLPGGYSRSKVYPLFGFAETDFLDSFPQRDLIRDFVSDREMFRFIAERYDQRDPSRPYFLFGITMQNHGGYAYAGSNATPRFELEGFSESYPQAGQYLGLLRESDRALEELIEHFEGVDSPVLILFFGDHLPHLEEGFYRELHGGDFDELADWQLRRTVPFVIWANYDIPERDAGLTSLSSLSNFLYEAAGLELPPYNRFLRDMAEAIPAMNALGYYSRASGKFLPYGDAEGEEAAWLRDYAILQYNSLFDAEHRSELFFPPPEISGAE